MICLKLNWFFYGLSRMLQFSQFLWAIRSSVWDVFNNFLLIDATDRSKISSDQKRFFVALSLYPLSFFANTPFNVKFKNFFFENLRICFNFHNHGLFSIWIYLHNLKILKCKKHHKKNNCKFKILLHGRINNL